MTTKKDMIPSQRKLNSNSASFALGGTTRKGRWAAVGALELDNINRLDAESWAEQMMKLEYIFITWGLSNLNMHTHSWGLICVGSLLCWVEEISDTHSFTIYSLVCCSGSVFTCGNNLAACILFPSRIITKSRRCQEKKVNKKALRNILEECDSSATKKVSWSYFFEVMEYKVQNLKKKKKDNSGYSLTSVSASVPRELIVSVLMGALQSVEP